MRNRISMLAAAAFLTLFSCAQAYAMEAPGDGEANWYYNQKNHHWYYYHEDEGFHTGWLNFQNEWYWFDSQGWMQDGGPAVIDGVPYYFFINGHLAWNQYVGTKYYDENGQSDEEHDIRIIGKTSPTTEERDILSDYLYEIPRSWIAQFIRDGWQMMFYTDKSYFAAPSTDLGIYYVYHSVDTYYKKVKFTDVDSALQAFGEYIGYASGCYKEGNARMEVLWQEQQNMEKILEIPAYYADDAQFYFGKVFAAYLDPVQKEEMILASPAACEVMEELLHLKDDVETRIRLKEKAAAEQEAVRERAERLAEGEGYGPGLRRATEEEIQEEHSRQESQAEQEESGSRDNGEDQSGSRDNGEDQSDSRDNGEEQSESRETREDQEK